MQEPTSSHAASPGFALAFWVTIVSGLTIAADFAVDVPVAMAPAAVAGFFVGCGVAGWLALRDARDEGTTFGRALGQGIRAACRWLIAFLP
ncbi:MAG: hypothetical protein M3237_13145 [Actinomycetota bacterium]|nr:hypothetical protein [Actinomycetota bacterium]